MLKKFTVSNYRSFEKPITIDFANFRDYDFNKDCIKNRLINKAIIYGKNAVGKTNFGEAITDIGSMVSNDRDSFYSLIEDGFINANSTKDTATFDYVFKLDDDEIQYTYEKYGINKLYYESLRINKNLLYEINFDTEKSDFSAFQNYTFVRCNVISSKMRN